MTEFRVPLEILKELDYQLDAIRVSLEQVQFYEVQQVYVLYDKTNEVSINFQDFVKELDHNEAKLG